jgi:hypothetical protein
MPAKNQGVFAKVTTARQMPPHGIFREICKAHQEHKEKEERALENT